MDRYRLKNIIILILLLMNLFLLGSLAQRRSVENATYRNSVDQIASLFADEGITLHREGIPRKLPPAPRSLTRSPEFDQLAAAFLLGDNPERADQGGGIYTYSGPRGAALFRSNGSFEAAGALSPRDGADFCREFCREFGYSEPVFLLDDRGTGTATAHRLWEDTPVYNCTVSFSLAESDLIGVSGTLLPELSAPLAAEAEPLSALAALTAFQQVRRATGAVVTDVTSVSLCYELQSTTAAPMTLTAAWCIDTNTAKYYVNSTTGAVRLL